MQGINRLFLMGRLGNVPKTFTTRSGKAFTGLSIATHRPTTPGDNGENKETTDWHFVRVWGKQAENCAKYLNKGQTVMVEGYLSQYVQTKEDGEGEKRTGINAIRVDFGPRANISTEVN